MIKDRILIVDDDPDIRQVIKVLLSSEGYEIEEAENGEVALKKFQEDPKYDIVVLDIMMPGMNGIEVCTALREISNIPVLFLSAKSQDHDKILAYTQGGDDYLVKPFSHTDILMKVRSLLRRYKNYNQLDEEVKEEEGSLKGMKLDIKRQTLLKGDVRINLTDKEFGILKFLLNNRGQVVENRELYEGVWGEKYLVSAGNTIMVHVLNLRKKIENDANNPEIVKTVWGKGYKID